MLLWAAGGVTARPAVGVLEHPDFMPAVLHHRLVGRLLRRLVAERLPVPTHFLAMLWNCHGDIVEQVAQRLATTRRIGKVMGALGSPAELVTFKGCTLYALTGDPFDIRRSNDLDVICADLDGFVAAAQQSGFRLQGKLDHLAEYAVLVDDEVKIELHSRFDVTSVAHRERLAPAAWDERNHFQVDHITWECFRDQMCDPAVIPAAATRTLRPELAAIVQAAHMYKEYMRFPYPRRVATIRLDEVATFVDLLRLPGFEPTRFAELVRRVNAGLAVAFSSRLAADLLAARDIAERYDDGGVIPGNLWWDGIASGFPVDLGWDPIQLVLRDSPIATMADALGAGDIAVPASLALSPDGGLYRGDRQAALNCAMSSRNGALRLEFEGLGLRPDSMFGVNVYLQDHRYETFVMPDGSATFTDYSSPRSVIRAGHEGIRQDDRACTRIVLPAQTVAECVTDGRIHGFFAVREQRHPWGEVRAGCAVPVRIALPA